MILVLGVGRSGTSEVAGYLRELGVFMGEHFPKADENNPKGYFEDKDFQNINMGFVLLGLDKSDHPEPWRVWGERFRDLVESREEPWGLKDPGIADFPHLLNEYMKLKPKLILCSRDKESVVRSYVRMKSFTEDRASQVYENRLENIKRALRGKEYLEIDCYADDKKEKLGKFLKV